MPRPIRTVAGVLVVAGLAVYVADRGQAAEPQSKPASTQNVATSDREAMLEREVASLGQQLSDVSAKYKGAEERVAALQKKVAELQRQLAQRPVLRIEPWQRAQPALPARPNVPRGATPHEFDGEPFYVIPLKQGN